MVFKPDGFSSRIGFKPDGFPNGGTGLQACIRNVHFDLGFSPRGSETNSTTG
jgi:hypothetical protein